MSTTKNTTQRFSSLAWHPLKFFWEAYPIFGKERVMNFWTTHLLCSQSIAFHTNLRNMIYCAHFWDWNLWFGDVWLALSHANKHVCSNGTVSHSSGSQSADCLEASHTDPARFFLLESLAMCYVSDLVSENHGPNAPLLPLMREHIGLPSELVRQLLLFLSPLLKKEHMLARNYKCVCWFGQDNYTTKHKFRKS
jgi:hypothetical protein